MLKEGNLNNQKLKSAQTNFSSKATTSSESSSMHAAYNSKNQKIPSSSAMSTPSASTSQNPIVTVQTAGRTDSNAINKNSISSSSLGGSSIVVGSDSPRQVDRLGVPQKEDSGTESGEDLRLIAAGLRDQLQIQSDSNIIEDVTCALSRLENSLNEGKDISIDSEKRKALLALVGRLRAGLTSPEKLAEIAAAMSALDGGGDGIYGSETSSPEADAHRSNRARFNKRRNRVSRHTVGVSREELADARRYMEDMLIMNNNNISQSTTPEANTANSNVPPQWYPIEKNASMGAILTETSAPILQRPKEFVPDDNTTAQKYQQKLTVNNGKRRPLSGEYSVTFEKPIEYKQSSPPKEISPRSKQISPPDDNSRNSRFSNKKHLMKRANTIDLAKSHKYNSELDTDSDAEDKGPHLGLKRAVQVSVKKRVQNVVPPFEPKTENDRKFLAFINKQSDKPGLGWTTSRSVSNWTNKFGSIKSTFEGGLTSKPPQAPHHVSAGKNYQSHKLFNQQPPSQIANSPAAPVTNYISNQQIAQRLQQEAQRQAEERRRHLEKERNRMEFERREREKLERHRQQRERQERERLEREHFERQRREQDQITAAQHAAILREQEQLAAAQQNALNMNVPKPLPINEFKHAPQSVFRPIDSGDAPAKPIYKPIPQLPRNANNWQSHNSTSSTRAGQHASNSLNASPSQYGNARPDDSFITSPPPSTRSPIGLPWASKPTVDNSSFKTKAHRFEEASKYDHIHSSGPYIQRHNSLRSSNGNVNHINEDFRKRPSLPNTFDPYSIKQMPTQSDPLAYLPPPQNISFTYSNLKPKANYQSYPCLPLAVSNNTSDSEYQRPRVDSLTNPHAVPLVLTSENPSYCPAPNDHSQQQLSQPRLPKQFELVSPADSTPTSPSVYAMRQTDCTDDDLDSDSNLLEYHAVSRVMGKPQCQTAVTVGRRTGHVSDDELYGKNSRAAKNLLSTMKSIGSNNNGKSKPKQSAVKHPEKITSPKLCLSPDGRSYQAPIVEPIFPEVTKFETNRKPVYIEQENTQNTAPTYQASQAAAAPRKKIGVYKSMESLNRNANLETFTQQPSPKPYVNQTTPTTTMQQSPSYQAQQPTYKASTQQQTSTKPYISETQTSYVVTYPIEDNTDDEDFSRQTSKTVKPPQTLDLRRQRNASETSTASSATTSISYSHNLPSPNTSWTSNPIVVDDTTTNYQAQHQTAPRSVQQQSHTEPTYQAHSTQITTNYGNTNSGANYVPPPADYIKKTAQYETPKAPVNSMQKPISTMKSSYEAHPQRQMSQHQTQQQMERTQKPIVSQKPTIQPTNQTSKTTTTNSSVSQEKRSLTSMRKTLSEDHQHHQHNIMKDQTILNPQHSNISQEMLERLDQQRERISNEIRRKSLGNALDYQMEKQARYETQQQVQQPQQYKSSAPPDTPDIVKSSLPKDENQPILKKFGPPQRHHYMPNSYQSPNVNTVTASTRSVVAATTSSQTTKIQNKNLQQTTTATTNKTMLKSAQQVMKNTRPTVLETPATPQPDDDYIPRNIVYNNIHAFSSMSRRQDDESLATTAQDNHNQVRPNKLSKSDSWNQIVMLQNQNNQIHSPKFSQSPTNELRRTKSGHTLALPKMYEAAMTKTDITEKQKTVAAYFSGQKSPTHQNEMLVEQQHQQQLLQQQAATATKRSVINRTKTSEKVSAACRKSLGSNLPIMPGGLTRSATMPHIANLNLLDESNVEDAFEQLIMGS